ncbi:hypothetical protein GGC65_002632 [Sphingopyxis sp. OAS728]|nr:hypothetical protein [Sphingopyxis sp. OAS728]
MSAAIAEPDDKLRARKSAVIQGFLGIPSLLVIGVLTCSSQSAIFLTPVTPIGQRENISKGEGLIRFVAHGGGQSHSLKNRRIKRFAKSFCPAK